MEDIKKGMNKIFNVSIATSVIILVLGIFLFIQPDTIIHMISIVLGGIILVSGIIALIDYFGSKYNPSLISGVITSIIGLILIINTKLVASILPFVLGIYFTINGINRLQYSLELKKEKMNYLSSFIVSILIIVCRVLFIINPFGGHPRYVQDPACYLPRYRGWFHYQCHLLFLSEHQESYLERL